MIKPKSSIRLLRANKPSFCHLSCRFSVTMEPHCAFKATIHLFKNIVYYHYNANERFGLDKILHMKMVQIKPKAHIRKCYLSWILLLLFISCQKDEPQPVQPVESPVNVIIDADLGSSTDDLFALMLLYRYADMGLANILAVVVRSPFSLANPLSSVRFSHVSPPSSDFCHKQ